MRAPWRLRSLPRISFERQAPQAASLRKKARLAEEALWRGFGCRQIIAGKLGGLGYGIGPASSAALGRILTQRFRRLP